MTALPALKSLRQERFVQELAKGKPVNEAYELAGYRPDRAHGSRLRNRPAIQARYNELIAASVRRTEVTAARIINELAAIAFSNVADFMTVGSDGQLRLDLGALTREQAAALEVTVDAPPGRDGKAGSAQRVRFKHDKRAALADLAKMLGLFRERVELSGTNGGPVEVREESDFEIAKRIAFVLAKAAVTLEQQTSIATPDPRSSRGQAPSPQGGGE